MKPIETTKVIVIPKDVSMEIEGRCISVKGKLGTLKRSFKEIPIDFLMFEDKLSVTIWFGTKKMLSCIGTVCSHIKNMINGVTYGYEYKMKSAYAHFPINLSYENDGTVVEVRNFLGEKNVRKIAMLSGVVCKSTGNKDEIVLFGNDIEKVSQSAALLQNTLVPRKKDKRKFLDGIYVSEKGLRSQ